MASNAVASQRVVPLTRLRPGYRHLRLHNELDQPLPLSQLFLCSQFLDGDLVDDDDGTDHLGAEEGDVFKDSGVAVEDGRFKRRRYSVVVFSKLGRIHYIKVVACTSRHDSPQ